MKYVKEILNNLNILNEILDEIGTSRLLLNNDFSVDEMSMEDWLKINVKQNGRNRIPLSFTFTMTGLEISLDRIGEAIDWNNEQLERSGRMIKTVLKNLLVSHILVEHYGSSRTQISLFGQDGTCTNNFKYREGFFLKGKREDKLYFPIYSLGNNEII